jgi:hypothetical protein
MQEVVETSRSAGRTIKGILQDNFRLRLMTGKKGSQDAGASIVSRGIKTFNDGAITEVPTAMTL